MSLPGQPPQKLSFFKKASIVGLSLSGIAVLGVSAFVIAQILMLQKDPVYAPEASVQAGSEDSPQPVSREVAAYTFTYALENVSIPLANRAATKIAYAQFNLKLDAPSAGAKKAMELHRAKLMDLLFEVATQFYLEDFKEDDGFRKFKKTLHKKYAGFLRALAPREVIVEDWVIQ